MSSRIRLPPSEAAGGDGSPPDGSVFRTRRERLRDLLLATEEGLSLEDLERILETTRSTLLADLEHLRLSFRHQDATLLMVPPSCTTCGFTFRLDVPKAPSKCPQCKSRALADPIFKATADA